MKQIKILYFWTIRFFKNHTLAIGVTILLIFLGYFLFNLFKDNLEKKTIYEGIIGTYTETNLPDTVTHLISSPLFEADYVGQPAPKLAKDWKVSSDSATYTVSLKDNLNWTDNTQINTSDFEIPLQEVAVNRLDGKTIQFKLSDSFTPFLSLLNKPILKNNSLVGTGPYKITTIKKDKIFISRLVLEPVNNKNLPQIVIRFYPNERIAKNALRLGEIQAILGVSDLGDLRNEPIYTTFSKTNYSQIVTIFYNTKDPVLSDENFRLALSFAAPSVKGQTEAVTSIPPSSWAFNQNVRDYLDNQNQATNYFARVKNGKDKPIVLTATTSLQAVGDEVVKAWNKQGIKAVLRAESGIPQNFQALLITQKIPTDPDQYSLWHSTQILTNISQFSNPRVDKDLEDGRKISDPAERKQKYLDFQKVLMDHSPATFLYFPKYNVVYMRKIEPELKEVLDLQLASM
jgi:peptide/nickel transport system substrate-binding protein